MLVGGGRAVGLVIVALAVAKGVDRALPRAHVAVGLGLFACLVAIARAKGLTTADLGLARSSWPAGLRWGATAAALVGTAYALAYVTGPVQEALPDGEGGLGWTALWTVLVVIPPWDRSPGGAGVPGTAAGAAGSPVWPARGEPAVVGPVWSVARRAVARRRDGQHHDGL